MLTINTDGGARGNPGPAGIGVVISEHGTIIKRFSDYIGVATNNFAEYKALLLGLSEAAKLTNGDICILMDSELIVRQMNGQYKIKDQNLKILAADAQRLLRHFTGYQFKHIPREQNKEADLLVNEAIDAHKQPSSV